MNIAWGNTQKIQVMPTLSIRVAKSRASEAVPYLCLNLIAVKLWLGMPPARFRITPTTTY